jgi:hypothetical protein
LPRLSVVGNVSDNVTSVQPGAEVVLRVQDQKGGDHSSRVEMFDAGRQYYAVFFHGLLNVSVPIDFLSDASASVSASFRVTIPPGP